MFARKNLLAIVSILALVTLVFAFAPTLAAQAPTATFTATSTSVVSAPVTATVTLTPTATTVPPTATKTVTAVVPTATKTVTVVVPTATKTVTAVVPTATKTVTAVVPTATKTITASLVTPTKVVTATATVTKTATVTATKTSTPSPTPTKPRVAAPRAGVVSSLSTMFAVQNMDAALDANVTATFYDSSGSSTGTTPVIKTIPPYRNSLIDQRIAGGGLDGVGNWQGGVVLSANTQVAATVFELSGNAASLGTDFRFDAYTGMSSTRAATTVILTQLYKDVYDSIQNKRYNSQIVIQNTSLTASGNVTVTYFGLGGSNLGTYVHSGINIPPAASKVIDLSSDTSEPSLPTSPANFIFLGAGVLTADPSLPVVVVVNHNAAGSLTSQAGLSSADAATTLYFPQLYRDISDPLQGYIFGSSIQVMKPNPSDTTPVSVTVTYNNKINNRTTTQQGQLNASTKSLSFDQRFGGVDSPFYGSATVVADAPVVATANLVSNFTSLGGRATTYRAIPAGTGANTLFIPLLLKSYYDIGSGVTYGTAFQGRTTSGGSATVTVTYYYTEGGVAKQLTLPAINVTPSSPQFTVEQRAGYDTYLPMGVMASAVVTSTAPIAATVNVVGVNGTPGDGSGTYDGVSGQAP